jgi:DNA polymerase III delta prime subunit
MFNQRFMNLNLFHLNVDVKKVVLDNADYELRRYSDFISNAIKLRERETLSVVVQRAHIPVLPKEKNDTPIFETRYYLPADADKKQQKVIDLILGEQTNIVFEQKRSFSKDYEIKIIEQNEQENYILLARDTEASILYLKPDTYQLEQQQKALETLRSRPLPFAKPLLKLFGKPEHFGQTRLNRPKVKNWLILNDDSRSGTTEQRRFVEKALDSPDFSLLEGPPGSGKTTAIIELILQLVLQNKRVLLCSATHAAIDNVFERVQGRYKTICGNHIVPVRISHSEKPVQENVRPYILKNLVNTYKSEIKSFLESNNTLESQEYLLKSIHEEDYYVDRIILESANLVAGTMIGILQHPDIRKNHGDAAFDVLIVDESSKVTFQEFLIPALHAKRWVLVGDVKQLSPYAENDYVAENLKSLLPTLQQEILSQQFELKKAMGNSAYSNFVKIYFVQKNLLEEAKLIQHEFKCNIVIIDKQLIINDESILSVNAADIVICETCEIVHLFLNQHLYMPSIFINGQLDERSPAIYRQNVFHAEQYRNSGFCDTRPYEFESTSESWAEMVASKLTQSFSFRMAGNAFEDIDKALNYLIPNYLAPKIAEIKRIAFPSVLEMLQNGIGKVMNQRDDKVLSDGLSAESKSSRFESLIYQHRMHPNIAHTSKLHFYAETGNLQSANTVLEDRGWRYAQQETEVKWVHNNDNTFQTGRKWIINPTEVKQMEVELRHFLDWAAKNPKQNGEKYEVAILTFYLDPIPKLREMVRRVTGLTQPFSRFSTRTVEILLYTVDKFQGQEADMVLLGFTKWGKNAHFNSPNRLNVALTRARFKLVLFGNVAWFQKYAKLEALKYLATHFKSNLNF